ncbi:MAG TPA: BamA/TamA family outer membrane protein [Flavitalea sp.]|nr:BamA/TamA family outer membrane protein [Flavitalea sp.]
MNRVLFLFLIVCMGSIPVIAQSDTILSRIVLIGDGGQFTKGKHLVAEAVRRNIPLDAKTLVLYLGDNLYRVGLPDDAYVGYEQAKSILDSQLSVVENTAARVIMIPGNHDWNNGGKDGYNSVVRQQYYVDLLGKKNVKHYPEGGCPGPVEVSLNDDIVLVIIDSQWWLHPFDKPEVDSDCPYKTKEEVLTQLNDILARNYKKLVIFACHHPFRTYGLHGGAYGLKQHIFPFTDLYKDAYIPLPVLGSAYPISRSVFGTPQDLRHPLYSNLVDQVEQVMKSHPNTIFVHGHDHSLQFIRDSFNYIVSGSGSKFQRVVKTRKTPYVKSATGFATLDISKKKNVTVNFYVVDGDSAKKDFTGHVLDFSKLPEIKQDTVLSTSVKYKDTINMPASTKYDQASGIQRLMMGNNYRAEWSTPVNLRVFNINKEKGGFKILSLGGGKQTRSLKLIDKDEREWTLRTIDKDPEKAIPENFRNSLAQDIVQDMISASHPYSAVAIPSIANAIKITVPVPEFFFVPDDPAFGFYRSLFANKVCLLELRDPTRDSSESRSTAKLLEKMVDESDHRVEQRDVLRARLLDMVVADFDRHFDQWKWGTIDTGKGKVYYPIARDRDQAFFNSDGLLLKVVSQRRLPFLRGFKPKMPAINWLNWSARDFDRIFLNKLDKKTWEETIRYVQENLTDSVLSTSVHRLPDEIFPLNGEHIIETLVSRRNMLLDRGMHYYKFLADDVSVVGTNKSEYFRVGETEKGLNVTVYERKNRNDTSYKIYERNFVDGETDEIRLFGLNGNDLFEVDDDVASRIKLRIIGGKGNDTFNIKGNVRNFLYDVIDSFNVVKSHNRSKMRLSHNPSVNQFRWVDKQYTQVRFPRIVAGFNTDDGVLLGFGYWRRTFGFRKEPFASDNRISAVYAPQGGAYQVRYHGEIVNLFGKADLVLDGQFVNPTLNNFFGLGNNTVIDDTKPIEFYRVRYNQLALQALYRRRYFDKVNIYAGPMFYYYSYNTSDNTDKILTRPGLIGLDSMSIVSNKTYAGAKIGVDINNLNSELFPTRGIHWTTEFSSLAPLSKNGRSVMKLTSDMAVYASLNSPSWLVAVLRLGGGHILNEKFEYFQALNLGANNFLRGFRKNRFSGSSLAYGSLEMRIKLLTSKWYILPGDFGLIAFNDIGRVWMKNEMSKRWHNAYGGGIYYVPFNMVIVSATMGFSKEEDLFNFSIGTKLNITF